MIIGIDPDLEKSGFAVTHDGKDLYLQTATNVEIVEAIRKIKHKVKCVYVEAGWLNQKANWHPHQSQKAREAIARNVGENHAVGKLLIEFIQELGVEVRPVKPTEQKLNALQFAQITGYQGSTNQEVRDAGMLIFGRY